MPFPAVSAGKSRLINTSSAISKAQVYGWLQTVLHTFVDRYHAAMLASDFLAKGICRNEVFYRLNFYCHIKKYYGTIHYLTRKFRVKLHLKTDIGFQV